MIRVSNDCCSCSSPGYPCIGVSCELRHNPHYFCDDCGDEVEQGELFWFDGQQLCIECIKNNLNLEEVR
jgi:hypothetical protein